MLFVEIGARGQRGGGSGGGGVCWFLRFVSDDVIEVENKAAAAADEISLCTWGYVEKNK